MLIANSVLVATSAAEPRDCLSNQYRFASTIERIIDGDTVELIDNRQVRIIGINTLELNDKFDSNRRWAETATARLRNLVKDQKVFLVPGVDTHDRHGRLLAHIVTIDEKDVAARLVSEGLALAVAIGRNTRCANDNQALESIARSEQKGIWKKPGRWLHRSSAPGNLSRGFFVILSEVSSEVDSNEASALQLANGLTVTFSRGMRQKYSSWLATLENLKGMLVEVRGWINHSSTGTSTLVLHHPSSLSIVTR